MKSSENIQKLITLLSQSSIEDYKVLLHNFSFSTIDFKSFESWSSKKYTRNCIYRDADFELIVLCWEKGQETAIHGHDGEDCWVYLLEGEMEEVFYTINNTHCLNEEHSQKMFPKQVSFMNDRLGFHKLKNSFNGRSVSLHVYAKPIENCRSFDEVSQQFVKRTLHYDTHKQLAFKAIIS